MSRYFSGQAAAAHTAPVPGQGSIGSNFTGGIHQPDGSTIWYIDGKESPVPYLHAAMAVGKSGILNGPDSAKVMPEDHGYTVESAPAHHGYIDCGTF